MIIVDFLLWFSIFAGILTIFTRPLLVGKTVTKTYTAEEVVVYMISVTIFTLALFIKMMVPNG